MKYIRILLFFILIYRVLFSIPALPENVDISIKGKILREVVRGDNYQKIEIAGYTIFLDRFPRVFYGDNVMVHARVESGKIVDAKLVGRSSTNNIFVTLREKLLTYSLQTLPVENAALINGIVLGSKTHITSTFWEKLKKSGTAHVVVASGTNVLLTGNAIIAFLIYFIDRRKALIISIFGIWIYVFLSGFDAPLVRAAIMGSISFFAVAVGRVAQTLRIFIYTIVLMLIIFPIWVYDVGFQLSAAATLSLIVFERYIHSKLQKIPSILRADLSATLTAQIGVAPLLLFYFGNVNLIAPFSNMLVLWTIPYIMIIGSFGFLVSLFSQSVGSLVFFVLYPLTEWFIVVIDFFSSI